MLSPDPHASDATKSGTEASHREKTKLRKKTQAAAKKAAKKLAIQADDETSTLSQDARRAAIAAAILTKMTTPANTALAAFAASNKKVFDPPANILQRIFEHALPPPNLLQATGCGNDWKVEWSGPR